MTEDEIKSLTDAYIAIRDEYVAAGTKGVELNEAEDKLKAALIASGFDVQRASDYLTSLHVEVAPPTAF